MTVIDIVHVRLALPWFWTPIIVRCFVRRLHGQVDPFCVRLSFYRSVTATQFKLCFDVQRSKHSFVADRSDTNLIDDVTMPCPLNAIDSCYC